MDLGCFSYGKRLQQLLRCMKITAALLLVAANETCPQPQTSEHLAAVEIMKLEHLIILQNKVDLIKEAQALEHQKSIAAFVKGVPSLCPVLNTVSITFDADNRDRCGIVTHCADFCSAQVQHRCRERIHRQAYTHTRQRLHF